MCSIVVADGDSTLLKLVECYLSFRGHSVFSANGAIDAMSAVRAVRPDIVVVDAELQWGGWTGIRALMNEDPFLVEIPLVLIADRVPADDLRDAKRPVIASWLSKPFRLFQLQVAIENSLAGRNMARCDSAHRARPADGGTLPVAGVVTHGNGWGHQSGGEG